MCEILFNMIQVEHSKSLIWSTIFLFIITQVLSMCKVVLPDIRIFMHSDEYMKERLQFFQDAETPFNNDYPGLSCKNDDLYDPPPTYNLLRKRVIIGSGQSDYNKAVKHLFNFDMINTLQWARFVTLKSLKKSLTSSSSSSSSSLPEIPTLKTDDMIATEVKCYNLLWSFNPSRVVCKAKDKTMRLSPTGLKRIGSGGNGVLYDEKRKMVSL